MWLFPWTRRQLDSPDAASRRRALVAVSRSRSAHSTTILVAALADRDQSVVAAAVDGLVGRADDETVLPLLKGALADPHARIRAGAVTVLSSQRATPFVELMVRALADRDFQVRAAAEGALAKLGDWGKHEGARAAVPYLSDLVRSADGAQDAVAVLGRIHDDRRVAPLLECLQSDDWPVHVAAAKALTDIHTPQVVEALLEDVRRRERPRCSLEALATLGDERAVPMFVRHTNPTSEAYLLEAAVTGLMRVGSSEAITRVIEVLQTPDHPGRLYALRAAAQSRSGRQLQEHITPLLFDARLRKEAALCLEALAVLPRDKRALARYFLLLGQSERVAKYGARIVVPLTELVEPADEELATTACLALGEVAATAGDLVPLSLATLGRALSSTLVNHAAEALAKYGDAAISILGAGPNEWKVDEALWRIGSSDALLRLIHRLDGDHFQRERIGRWLEKTPNVPTSPLVERLVRFRDSAVEWQILSQHHWSPTTEHEHLGVAIAQRDFPTAINLATRIRSVDALHTLVRLHAPPAALIPAYAALESTSEGVLALCRNLDRQTDEIGRHSYENRKQRRDSLYDAVEPLAASATDGLLRALAECTGDGKEVAVPLLGLTGSPLAFIPLTAVPAGSLTDAAASALAHLVPTLVETRQLPQDATDVLVQKLVGRSGWNSGLLLAIAATRGIVSDPAPLFWELAENESRRHRSGADNGAIRLALSQVRYKNWQVAFDRVVQFPTDAADILMVWLRDYGTEMPEAVLQAVAGLELQRHRYRGLDGGDGLLYVGLEPIDIAELRVQAKTELERRNAIAPNSV